MASTIVVRNESRIASGIASIAKRRGVEFVTFIAAASMTSTLPKESVGSRLPTWDVPLNDGTTEEIFGAVTIHSVGTSVDKMVTAVSDGISELDALPSLGIIRVALELEL